MCNFSICHYIAGIESQNTATFLHLPEVEKLENSLKQTLQSNVDVCEEASRPPMFSAMNIINLEQATSGLSRNKTFVPPLGSIFRL